MMLTNQTISITLKVMKVVNNLRWVKKMNDCLEICTRKIGCSIKDGTTHQICKKNNIHSYDELNQYFTNN